MSPFWFGLSAVAGTAVGAVVGDAIGSRVMSDPLKGAENGLLIGSLVGGFTGSALAGSASLDKQRTGTVAGVGALPHVNERAFP
jgi:uncharacterized protein YcfJ